jgi:hypothetical protein
MESRRVKVGGGEDESSGVGGVYRCVVVLYLFVRVVRND